MRGSHYPGLENAAELSAAAHAILVFLTTERTRVAKGKAGADSSVMVTSQVMGQGLIDLAKALYGEMPVFWGRYFTSTSTGGTVEYRHLKENRALRDNNIRVLPIARQTKYVDGTFANGSADAQNNADDLITTFGAAYLASLSSEFYMFLDVEGSPSVSQAYYTGWAQTLAAHSAASTGGAVTILPCVYATQSDNPTWSAVSAAMAAGAPCKGAWIARWPVSGCQPLPNWDDRIVTPSVGIPCPILIWQYADDCHGGGGFDCSETNPSIDLQDFLNHLILPPDMTGITT